MQIDIQAQGFELSNALRQYIERNISSTFRYMERKVSTVVVSLSNDGSDLKNNSKICRIQAVVNGLPHVITKFRSKNYYHAVGVAILRSKQAVSKRLDNEIYAI